MKLFSGVLLTLLFACFVSGCSGRGSGNKKSKSDTDTIAVPDTGFTGIKQLFSSNKLVQEVTLKNGIRHGLTKSFYEGGQLRLTFWYENGLREDSSRWYYTEGQLFRATPFKHDTIDGIQKQYFRNGRTRAKIGFEKGFRNPFLEEFDNRGTLITGYPETVVSIEDEYQTKGIYRINLELSDKSKQVKFHRGEFTQGRFDTTKLELIKTVDGKGSVTLKKSGTPTSGYVGVITESVTKYANKRISYKKIDLPYNDLK